MPYLPKKPSVRSDSYFHKKLRVLYFRTVIDVLKLACGVGVLVWLWQRG